MIFIFYFDDLHLQIIQAFPPYFTGWSLAFVNKALTECINLLDPSAAGGGGGAIITYFYWSCVYKYITGNAWVSALPKKACWFLF